MNKLKSVTGVISLLLILSITGYVLVGAHVHKPDDMECNAYSAKVETNPIGGRFAISADTLYVNTKDCGTVQFTATNNNSYSMHDIERKVNEESSISIRFKPLIFPALNGNIQTDTLVKLYNSAA